MSKGYTRRHCASSINVTVVIVARTPVGPQTRSIDGTEKGWLTGAMRNKEPVRSSGEGARRGGQE